MSGILFVSNKQIKHIRQSKYGVDTRLLCLLCLQTYSAYERSLLSWANCARDASGRHFGLAAREVGQTSWPAHACAGYSWLGNVYHFVYPCLWFKRNGARGIQHCGGHWVFGRWPYFSSARQHQRPRARAYYGSRAVDGFGYWYGRGRRLLHTFAWFHASNVCAAYV